ncbi:MAG: hypothetical protein HKM98_09890, partial [Gammaproteobacteria bacterium]|nr:hypothetical protein [Gammaproteobacteria bacterium]
YYAVNQRLQDCPSIQDTPAYRKLPVGTISEQCSLRALDDAQDEIAQIRKMLLG